MINKLWIACFLHTCLFLLCISHAVHPWLIKAESLQVKFQPWFVGFMASKGKCSLSSSFLKFPCISGVPLPLVRMASVGMQLIALLLLCRVCLAVVAVPSVSPS